MTQPQDRRKTGIHRTTISDGNGGALELITMTAQRVRVIAGSIAAVAVLLGMIFGAVKMGVSSEVNQQIYAAATEERGIIRVEVLQCVEASTDELETKFGLELEALEEELDHVGDTGEGLLIEVGNMQTQIDTNHQEIMRALRARAGDES